MINKRESAGWIVAAMAIFALYVATLAPQPYTDVAPIRIERVGDVVEFEANFKKTGCTFQRLRVVVGEAGQTRFVGWRDLEAGPEVGDRNKGLQTLRLILDLPADVFDWAEIRTRHDCDGEKYDKVFWRLEPVP